ncbi:unnamed protein product [Miscanthus lutarioriparius]|uniref:Uncharacterized protein n=1 Tax=Miscanthus lutarioriparius TaxID=422564 RepID=A0A811QP46_9POAL|nr:unnamed protein product [Miscanthus lutarioriparius]
MERAVSELFTSRPLTSHLLRPPFAFPSSTANGGQVPAGKQVGDLLLFCADVLVASLEYPARHWVSAGLMGATAAAVKEMVVAGGWGSVGEMVVVVAPEASVSTGGWATSGAREEAARATPRRAHGNARAAFGGLVATHGGAWDPAGKWQCADGPSVRAAPPWWAPGRQCPGALAECWGGQAGRWPPFLHTLSPLNFFICASSHFYQMYKSSVSLLNVYSI